MEDVVVITKLQIRKTPPAEVAGEAGNERTGSIVPGFIVAQSACRSALAEGGVAWHWRRENEHRGKLVQEPAGVKAWPVSVVRPIIGGTTNCS
ncbi:hypothetical protein [Mesorhizobium australafricanum]|uniref:Uncharacterized protein n=1 Tax=Mesorhizobium australafricanum TaxID=3072311 RepID=A0ABU4WU41_9HYPH|nr:hypothetical protein [Mesorhizobium sp. VK3E]MDX8438324.1 hypothetical protein [Mesorhizobium sp. VK3E]